MRGLRLSGIHPSASCLLGVDTELRGSNLCLSSPRMSTPDKNLGRLVGIPSMS